MQKTETPITRDIRKPPKELTLEAFDALREAGLFPPRGVIIPAIKRVFEGGVDGNVREIISQFLG